jgi:hypothetical protein
MPIALPELDDRRFDDLMAEARALIPARDPGWTDHNPTDPGITILELFAWLNEVLMYRINRITSDNTLTFLRLLNGPEWKPSADGDLGRDVRQTVLEFRRCDRAVTPEDFETLALAADPRVTRACCIPRRDLTGDSRVDAPAHVSVAVVPVGGGAPPPDLISSVAAYLEERRLLTTRLHVVAARRVPVSVALTINLKADGVEVTVRSAVVAAVTRFLDPIVGGRDGAGWPFGRGVFVSEIYQLLSQIPGVDFLGRTGVTDELATVDPAARILNAAGDFVGIALTGGELPIAAIDSDAFTIIAPAKS